MSDEPTFEVFHNGKPTGVKAYTYSDTLDLAVEVMKENPTWEQVKVMEGVTTYRGSVWRNFLEGRLIKSKLLG